LKFVRKKNIYIPEMEEDYDPMYEFDAPKLFDFSSMEDEHDEAWFGNHIVVVCVFISIRNRP
jgi:hypothetical protein